MDMIAINQMIDKVKQQGCKLNISNEDFVKAVLLIATSNSYYQYAHRCWLLAFNDTKGIERK